MVRYLFVTDPEGREIAGSRRSVEGCRARTDVTAIERTLASSMGEGCTVQDNVDDWRSFWAERE